MAQAQRLEAKQTDKGYVPSYATGIVEQPWDSYEAVDHQTWETLFRRQRELLIGRACDELFEGMARFGMDEHSIPKFGELNAVLGAATGWQLVAVEGLLPEFTFFEHLANRRFPVTWWIRRPEQIDYLSEPDLFHDLFGHVPLLLNPIFADYMQAYGAGGLKAAGKGDAALAMLTRLYWYTVEFGLINTPQGLRIYGAGIASSKGESEYSLESDCPNRIGFDLFRVMRTRYRIDRYQKTYFVINSFDQLFAATEPDFTPYYAALADASALPAGQVEATDKVWQRGTGADWDHSADT